tara:strand:+ start:273 stop:461 length:189 start_codon:yes stop_codon:yes gene_type:complete
MASASKNRIDRIIYERDRVSIMLVKPVLEKRKLPHHNLPRWLDQAEKGTRQGKKEDQDLQIM